jgi:RHS repeat-associated protein
VGYAYDPDGDVDAITYPLPSTATWATTDTINYTYDKAGLLTQFTDFNDNPVNFSSNADGLADSIGLGSTGDTITTTYDNTDAPSAITLKNSASTLQSFTYADSPAGTILSETDAPSSSKTPATYTYDASGRVTSMTSGTGSPVNYTYDPSGNLTTLPNGASAASGYDNAGELTSSTLNGTTTSYTYDADGQRLKSMQGSATVTSGTWNGAGQLTSYASPSATMTAATYDGNGLRATATTNGQAQAFTWSTVDGSSDLIMDGTNAYIYAGGTAPSEQVNLATGAITYLIPDSLGSVRGAVNSSGSLTGTASYDAWGNPEATGGLTAITPFGYAGGYTDATGLIYLDNRYYDPATGQFTSLDPEVDQTLQPFDYAGDNPVSATDPTGLGHTPPPCGGSQAVPSCRYLTALAWTDNQMWSVVYGHGKSHGEFETISNDWPNTMVCIAGGVIVAGICATAAKDWADQVRADGAWDLKVGLRHKQFIHDSYAAEPNEWPWYARANEHTQIYFGVWGNIFYGYVGRMEGFPVWLLQDAPELLGSSAGDFGTAGNSIERHMGYDLFGSTLDEGDINGVILAHIHELSDYCDAIPFPPPDGERQYCKNPAHW